MTIRIEPLAAHAGLVATVAAWHFDEWGHQDPGGSVHAWAERLARRAQPAGVPSYYVAFADGVPVGSVGLCESDMSTRPELSPWLSGLYVRPPFRGRGIAKSLVEHAMAAARRVDVKELHLHTASAESLYLALGWRVLARELYEGERVAVLAVRL